ncbi:MAG: DUF262 domain-containing protein [Cyanobacteria bacterium RUI128]|nr:DUF262 domain-containing protein [Cyanobacteria bacterium RUI128]
MSKTLENNTIKTIRVGELLGIKYEDTPTKHYTFKIPNYQRGYRWEKQHILTLLNDIKDFSIKTQNNEEYYCLQPVVVKKDEDGNYELIDGQQRLTTIYIIAHTLKHFRGNVWTIYNLIYDGRTNTQNNLIEIQNVDFSKDITDMNTNEDIDSFYIKNACSTIKNWIEENKQEDWFQDKFIKTFLSNTRIIWYDINDSDDDPIPVFKRLNKGKIPLNDAELIKALFLKSCDTDSQNKDIIKKTQFIIAEQWDNIEKAFQNDNFWYFLSNDNKKNNRIELLLDIVSGKNINEENIENFDGLKKSDEHYTFRFFEKLFNSSSITMENKEKIWNTITDYFYMLQGWYNDRELYHYVGYLICTGMDLYEICNIILDTNHKQEKHEPVKLKKHFTRRDFITRLKQEIKTKVIDRVINAEKKDRFNYSDNRDLIYNVLLLHNILSLLENEESAIYNFPFDKFKDSHYGWDVEHISPCTSGEGKAPDKAEDIKKWYERNIIKCEEVKNSLEETTLQDFKSWWKDVEEYNKDYANEFKLSNELKDSFTKNYDRVIDFFNGSLKGIGKNRTQNTIANLVLLDSGTNREYGNDLFPIKRKTIIEYDKASKFIPPCTKNAFLMYYGGGYDNKWTEGNALKYKNDIERLIKNFFDININNEGKNNE